ncbi:MAG TPA: hypothetical protein VFB38_18715 [Chthonomonadaceae bacterium]|nr:hypothetical protein [Chthonomonadaceae bacterium]
MALREDELYIAMQRARDEYHKARRELAEFAARVDREMYERAVRVDRLHCLYKEAWAAWTEEKQRAFIAELEAVPIAEEMG